MKMSVQIGTIIEKEAKEIFLAHRSELLSEQFDYIIHAVWGVAAEEELSSGQEKINKQVLCALDLAREIFAVTNLDMNQKFALDYHLRNLISTKIMLMMVAFESEVNMRPSVAQCTDYHSGFLM